MRIHEKLPSGYRIACDCGHTFVVRRLGLGIECPTCGATETSATLLDAYSQRMPADGQSEAA